jgi:DNA-binding MarR family transcriptional regulator
MATKPAPRYDVLLELAVTNAWVSQLFDQELVRRGLQPAQAGVLAIIGMNQPVTPTQLENEMGLPGATLRERVGSLLESGLVERAPNKDDGRSYLLSTTPKGDEVLENSAAAVRTVQRELEKVLGFSLQDLRRSLVEVRTVAQGLSRGDLITGKEAVVRGPW